MIVRHTDALSHLPSAIGLHRAGLAQLYGGLRRRRSRTRTRRSSRAGSERPLERGGAVGLLALAHWWHGELDAAHAAWSQAIGDLGGRPRRRRPGLLDRARRHPDPRGRLGTRGGPTSTAPARRRQAPRDRSRGTADMHVGLGELQLERNELAEARRTSRQPLRSARRGLPQNPYRRRVALARLRAAEGDSMAARRAARRGRAPLRRGTSSPTSGPIAAMRARTVARAGAAGRGARWVRERGLSRRRRADVPARVRAPDAGAGAPARRARTGPGRAGAPSARLAAAALPTRGGRRRS